MIGVLRPLCLSLSIAALTAAVVYIAAYLAYPVTGVQVEGARMLPETKVLESVSDRASLLTLNQELLERRLKSNPWVESAVVLKDWKSGIVTVEVEERRPILKSEVDGREAVYAADGTELPRLGGASLPVVGLNEKRLEKVLSSGRALQENGAAVDSIVGAGPGGVEALVEGRRVVFSGVVADAQARGLSEIMRQNPAASDFDLRSPERIVVGGASGGPGTEG